MRDDDIVRLRHVLDPAREAMGFAQGRIRADLDTDRMLVLSLVKSIEIIGEAAYGIPAAVRGQLPGVPWDDIIGMRHRLIHAYFDISLDILWRTVQDDPPPLASVLESLVPSDQASQ
jgi:uncharacterized protein with HEPN domain